MAFLNMDKEIVIVKCPVKTSDGHCSKRNGEHCKPSDKSYCDEEVLMIDVGQMCRHSSIFGNTYSFITNSQLEELKSGKAIYINDGEYCHFIVLKEE